MNLRILVAALMLAPFAAHAQPAADTASIWTLQGENASITTGTPPDRFYVNGLRLGWTSPTTVVPDVLAGLGRILWGDGQQRVAVDITQQIYTPADTTTIVPNPHDRPFAGVLLGNFSLIHDTANTRSTLTLSLGVVGPDAGAEQLQNDFHNLIGQQRTIGWGGQIQNTPAVEILHERIWRLPLGRVAGLETDVLPALTLGVGNLRDYLQVGTTVRFGRGLDSDFGVPRLRPGLSGGDAFTPTSPFAWYVFAGVNGQAVAYDMLLQSSPFRGGPHVDAIWDVGEMQAGFAIIVHGMRLTFAYVAQTQEFQGQTGGLHQFGSASLSVRF
jgi:lipid A 3-O-deacylase